MLHASNSFLKWKAYISKQQRRELIFERKLKLSGIEIQKDVEKFLECDENSRMCPGKKDTLTRNKVKKQKILLNDSLKILYRKFNERHSYSIS